MIARHDPGPADPLDGAAALRAKDILGGGGWRSLGRHKEWFALTALLLAGPKHAPTARDAAVLLGYGDEDSEWKRGGDAFGRDFLRAVGRRYGRFVHEWRMREGARLLFAHPAWGVFRVAQEVGYAHEVKFCRAYSEYFGQTPRGVNARRRLRRGTGPQGQLQFEFVTIHALVYRTPRFGLSQPLAASSRDAYAPHRDDRTAVPRPVRR